MTRWRRGLSSLRTKLLVFSLLLVVVPGVVFALMAIAGARRALESTVGRQLAEVAHDTATELRELVRREQKDVQTWARQDLMREVVIGDLDKRIARFLVSVKESDPAYLDLACIDATGRVVAATDPGMIGTPQGEEHWAQVALSGHEFLSGREPRGAHAARSTVEIAAPVFDPDRRSVVIGALLGRLDWDLAAASTARRVQRNSATLHLVIDIAVLDGNGTVTAEAPPLSGPGLLGRNLRAAGWRAAQPPLPPARPSFLREPGAAVLVGFAGARDPRSDWTVLVMQSFDEAFAPVARLQRRLVLMLAGILLSALGVAMLLAERMGRPLRELMRATGEIAHRGETQRLLPVRSHDEIGELAQAFNTMTRELKRAQDDLVAAAKFAFLGEVAAGVAHEIRTPLGILRSSAQILSRSVPADQPHCTELLEMMIGEVDRLDRVVDGLLQLARPHEPVFEPTPLATVLQRALTFIEGQAREQDVVLHHAFAADQRPARCDPEQIYQVVLNLIVNALQVLPKNGVPYRGELTVRTSGSRDGVVSFEVQDNGPGIPGDVRERIFTPFFTMRKGGTGLGLALVQRVVQAHQGRVSVDSVVGQGTTFHVELPAAEDGI